jgi:hypothetical protein
MYFDIKLAKAVITETMRMRAGQRQRQLPEDLTGSCCNGSRMLAEGFVVILLLMAPSVTCFPGGLIYEPGICFPLPRILTGTGKCHGNAAAWSRQRMANTLWRWGWACWAKCGQILLGTLRTKWQEGEAGGLQHQGRPGQPSKTVSKKGRIWW